jgi:hypothetical protein
MNHTGAPNFTAYSAGSHPSGTARAEAHDQIASAGPSTVGLRRKFWDEFSVTGAIVGRGDFKVSRYLCCRTVSRNDGRSGV